MTSQKVFQIIVSELLFFYFISFRSTMSWIAGILCWTCSVLQWNCICRSETLDALHYEHFDWVGDALKLTVLKTKKDQGGTGIGREKMLHSNPYRPVMDPVLACAVYSMAVPSTAETRKSTKFFVGNDQRQRYGHIMGKVLDSFGNDFIEVTFGTSREDIGTHSHRKGGITMLLSTLDGPNPCAVYIRAGWSLGNTQDRYIMGGPGEDDLCGRILCGLNLDSLDFTVLPPHFSKEGNRKLLEIGIDKFYEDADRYPDSFRRCMPFFIAAVLYHTDTLRQWWPDSNHPFWACKMFTAVDNALLDELRQHIVVCNSFCPDTGMKAAGVPSVVQILQQVHLAKDTMQKFAEAQELRDAERNKRLEDALAEALAFAATVPQLVTDNILKNLEVNGAVPLTKDSFDSLAESIKKLLHDRITSEIATAVQQIARINSSVPSESPVENTFQSGTGTDVVVNASGQLMQGGWPVYQYSEGFHMVPVDFKLSGNMSCKAAFIKWHLGQQTPVPIRPFKFLSTRYKRDVTTKAGRSQVSKLKLVMDTIFSKVPANTCITHENCTAVFEMAYTTLTDELYADAIRKNKRVADLTYTTLYNRIKLN
jgi:hypothetical protein